MNICYMSCHITCSKSQQLADTHARGQLRLSFTALSMAFSGKADQINKVHLQTWELFLASVAACKKTLAFPPSLTDFDLNLLNWDHSLLAMKSRRFDLMKLETGNVKNDGYS